MSYEAIVRCNCWKEGKTSPYPFDFPFDLDDESGFFHFGLDEEDDPFFNLDYERSQLFETWSKECCDHPYMEFVSLSISTSFGMGAFKNLLTEIGWQFFPALETGLPTSNDGSTPFETAQRMFIELMYLINQKHLGDNIYLVNSESGEVVQSYMPSREGVFAHHPQARIDIGLDENGFFIARRYRNDGEPILDLAKGDYKIQQPREDLFRAMNIEIMVNAGLDAIEYINLDSHEKYVSIPRSGMGMALYRSPGLFDGVINSQPFPQRLRVEKRPNRIKDFDQIIKALFMICDASIKTGNPIYWR